MRNVLLIMSSVAILGTMTACGNCGSKQDISMNLEKQEREFLKDAIRHRSPDLQQVDIVGNTVVYTHIFDGIIDIKTYTYDGDVCVEAERIYTFPDQMSALRHYRRAVEQAELYDNIELFKNQVKYDLKKEQYSLETKGLTKEQLKADFDKKIAEAKADIGHDKAKLKKDEAKLKGDVKKMKEDLRRK